MSQNWLSLNSDYPFPAEAVVGGRDSDGSVIYVGRATVQGETLPAKLIPSKGVFAVSHNGLEVSVTEFEALLGSGYTWVSSNSGNVPENAVMSGSTSEGEPLYIGRSFYEGSLTPGKVHQSHGCLYLPFAGLEQSTQMYEVLIAPPPTWSWSPWTAADGVPEGAIMSGIDCDGTAIYIGKVTHEDDVMPAKVLPAKECAYVCYGGEEFVKYELEVLCGGPTKWVKSGQGEEVPPGAIPGGLTGDGEVLYIGRGSHDGSLTVGKVQLSHATLYIAFDGQEISLPEYEILVEKF